MSYWCSVTVEELDLRIPVKDFPLKSNIIVGYENPKLCYPDDECSEDCVAPVKYKDALVWKAGEDESVNHIHAHDNHGEWIDALESIVMKYKGTLVAEISGEEGDVSYLRIRDGVKKRVRIVEEGDE